MTLTAERIGAVPFLDLAQIPEELWAEPGNDRAVIHRGAYGRSPPSARQRIVTVDDGLLCAAAVSVTVAGRRGQYARCSGWMTPGYRYCDRHRRMLEAARPRLSESLTAQFTRRFLAAS